MVSRNNRDLFEELGLLSQTEAPNPYKVLGLDPGFAAELLKEKDGEATLRLAAAALHKVLAKRHHPDVSGKGDESRFREVSDANTQITRAKRTALVRWSQKEQNVDTASAQRVAQERLQLTRHFTELFQENLELGNHPHHYSQLPWTQGLLLYRANRPYLMRQSPEGGVEVTRGHQEPAANPHGFSISRFLLQHQSFGLEPGTSVAAYVTPERASLVDQELQFIMDITDPVADYKRRRDFGTVAPDASDFWARSEAPLLMPTTIPKPGAPYPPSQMIVFPEEATGQGSLVRHIPMEVVGTLQDPDAFKRIRHGNNPRADALTGRKPQRAGYFNMAPVSVDSLIQKGSEYSPLLGGKGLLVLYDSENRIPIATDIQVAGMIGHNSRAA